MPHDASGSVGAPDHWLAPLSRAVPALVLAIAITFSGDHSVAYGQSAFGVFGVVTAAVLLASATRADREIRVIAVLHGIVTAVAAVAALVVPPALGVFVLIVSGWAVISGALEAVDGFRFRRIRRVARDWLTTGILTLLLAVVFLAMPQDYAQPWEVTEKGSTVAGVVTSDIVLVGVLGAWAAIVGVQLAIAAVSLRTPTSTPSEVEA